MSTGVGQSKAEFAVQGAKAALSRASEARDVSSQLAAIVESAWWIDAAHEYLIANQTAAYQQQRTSDVAGQSIDGIRWVRDKTVHDPVAPFALVERKDVYTNSYADLYGEWCWKPRTQIPISDPQRKTGEAQYIGYLEGKSARSTLREAVHFLSSYLGL